MISDDRTMEWLDLGTVRYAEAWALQERMRAERTHAAAPDRMLLLEHYPVISLGRRDCAVDVVAPAELLAREGIEVAKSNRGGRATWHGPGQLVGYFVCLISGLGMGVKDFVRAIEDMLSLVLGDFGIEAAREEGLPGLWVGRSKIAAIGLNISHGVTQHGFSLNVGPDLSAYRHIVACGVSGRGVTSIDRVTGRANPMADVKSSVVSHAGRVLGCRMRRASAGGEGEVVVRSGP